MICVTGAEPSLAAVAARIEALPEAALHEVRVDRLAGGAPADLTALPGRERLVVTCRRASEGGGFTGTDAEQVAWLEAALSAGVRAVDVEAAAPDAVWAALSGVAATRLVASAHLFEGGQCSAAALAPVWDRLAARPAGTVKLAAQVDDVVELGALRRLVAPDGRETVRVGMGLAGQVGRACPRGLGSRWTYVVAPGGDGTAPGQLGWESLAPFAEEDPGLLVLLGGPQVAHSPGPRVYTTLAREQGRPLVYLATPTRDPVAAVGELAHYGLAGASVTMPHKAALGGMVEARGFAARVGAINTLVRHGEGWRGENTDGQGVLGALAPALGPGRRTVLLLGTGGAARGAAFALAEAGHAVVVAGRRPEAAEALAVEVGGEAVAWGARGEVGFQGLVNATPMGADGVASPMPADTDWTGRAVLDMTLHPRDTALLGEVARGGGEAIAGVAMWVHQGAAQWARWTGDAVAPARLLALVDGEGA